MPEEIKNDMIEEKNLTKLLRVNFTAKEKLDIGDQMANAIRNIRQAEEDLASVSSQYKSEIKKHQAELTGLAEKLNSGWEMRSVSCLQIRDYSTKSVIVKRLDSGYADGSEVIEERAMTVDELQMGLFEKKEKSPAAEAESQSEPPVEGAEAEGESPEDLPDLDKNNSFYGSSESTQEE